MSGLGKANDKGVPREEMLLAKAVGNCKRFGYKAGRGAFMRDGRCCAMGALSLTSDGRLHHPRVHVEGLEGSATSGNDAPDANNPHLLGPAYDLGMCFQDAMADAVE